MKCRRDGSGSSAHGTVVWGGKALSIQPGQAVISGAALSACLAGIVASVPLRFALWVHGDGTGGDLCS
jgi:hypothetical protein